MKFINWCALMVGPSAAILKTDSQVQNVYYFPDERKSPEQIVDMDYYTSMDEEGVLTATFNVTVSDYDAPSNDAYNPRICLAIKEKEGLDDNYDIAQMSMRKFSDGYWSAKDGFASDPKKWCGQKWDDE